MTGDPTFASFEDFDHDGYVRERLPDFVLSGMGLRSASTPTPAGEVVQTTDPVKPVAEHVAESAPELEQVPPLTRSRPPAPEVERSRPSTEQHTQPNALELTRVGRTTPRDPSTRVRTKDEQLTKLARQTVTAVLAIPVWIIVIVLLVAFLAGPSDEPSVVVNDDPSCESGPLVLAPSELATRRYWEEC